MKIKYCPALLATVLLSLPVVTPLPAQTNSTNNPVAAQIESNKTVVITEPKNDTAKSSVSASVEINANGVHVGGANPVDIAFHPHGTYQLGGWETATSVLALAIVFGSLVLICIIPVYARHRRNKMLHETIRAMIEKGMPIPPELLSGNAFVMTGRRPRNDLRRGLVLIGVGIGIWVLCGRVGVIPLLMGVGFLVSLWLDKKNQPPTA